MEPFQILPVVSSSLPDVADFLYRWRQSEAIPQRSTEGAPRPESALGIERRLRWLLLENPAALPGAPLGYCVRDGSGVVRGLNLVFPAAFVSGQQRLLGLGSGSFFVEPQARSMGFFLFKKYLGLPGYSFFFATTCNVNSAALWSKLGGRALPDSEVDYVLPLRLDVMIPAFVATRTSSGMASGIARFGGRCANPVMRFLTRPSAELTITPCQDWEKLSQLSRRHQSAHLIANDRSVAFLRWRYGPDSPLHPCGIYLFQDKQGNEGWFALGNLIRGERWPFRGSVLLDAIWPRDKMSFYAIFQEILRLTEAGADAIFLRSQPGLDYREFSRRVMAYRLAAPRAFVMAAKDSPSFPLDSLDYDDSDYGAWKLRWTGADVSLRSGAA